MRAAAAVALGGVWGWFCWWGDHQNQWVAVMTNIGGPWLLLAFLMGMWASQVVEGGFLGALMLATAVFAYYGAYEITRGGSYPTADSRYLLGHGIAWVPVAAVGGVGFGVAGSLWRFGNDWQRPASVALLAGALIAEAILNIDDIGTYNRINAGHMAVIALEGVVGIALPFFLLIRGRELATGLAMMLVLAIVALGAERFVFNYLQNHYLA
jgi:Family of unknown function (DUF6518)